MKQFVVQSLFFVGLQFGLFALLLAAFHNLNGESNYLAAIADKHQRLQEACKNQNNEPCVILVGGSNLAFGIQSPRLESALNRPVTNLGLVAGLGLEFMLNQVRAQAGPGDVVVLSLEYEQFNGSWNRANLRQLAGYYPAGIQFMTWPQRKSVLLDHGLSVLGEVGRRSFGLPRQATSPEEAFPYLRRGFNQHGDLTLHYGKAPVWDWDPVSGSKPIFKPGTVPTEAVLRTLTEFAVHCQERGTTFAFSCPPYPKEMLEADLEIVEEILDALRGVSGLLLLDSPHDQAYSHEYFYDTKYHLTEPGAALRTSRLSRAIAAHL